jgi:hypothetical protein
MIPDDSQPQEDGVIFVKSADGYRPHALFEKVMCSAFGDDTTERHVHIHRDDTQAVIRKDLRKLHPDHAPAQMLIEGVEVDDDWPMSEWMTRPGTSDVRVRYRMEMPYQMFWFWTLAGHTHWPTKYWINDRQKRCGQVLGSATRPWGNRRNIVWSKDKTRSSGQISQLTTWP